MRDKRRSESQIGNRHVKERTFTLHRSRHKRLSFLKFWTILNFKYTCSERRITLTLILTSTQPCISQTLENVVYGRNIQTIFFRYRYRVSWKNYSQPSTPILFLETDIKRSLLFVALHHNPWKGIFYSICQLYKRIHSRWIVVHHHLGRGWPIQPRFSGHGSPMNLIHSLSKARRCIHFWWPW